MRVDGGKPDGSIREILDLLLEDGEACPGIGRLRLGVVLLRVLTDQNPFAHSLRPMDMMRQGWLSSFRQASQQ